MNLGEMDLEAAAKAAAGNWRHFDSFAWHRASKLRDAENWAIVYTHHRDSGLLDQSNSAAIEEAMGPFTMGRNPDVVPEHDHHWACGWVEGFSIRVFRGHRITKAFRTYHELMDRLANCAVLDESDYSRREYEATIENLTDAAWKLKHDYDLPDGWQEAVYDWLADNDCAAVEDTDDRSAWPDETQLRRAFIALGYHETLAV